MSDQIDEILTKMVENTMMIITNDLPSLLEQDDVYKIRRHHKDDILKNLPEARAAIEALVAQEKIKQTQRCHRQTAQLNQPDMRKAWYQEEIALLKGEN
jgi:hypothetical protein